MIRNEQKWLAHVVLSAAVLVTACGLAGAQTIGSAFQGTNSTGTNYFLGPVSVATKTPRGKLNVYGAGSADPAVLWLGAAETNQDDIFSSIALCERVDVGGNVSKGERWVYDGSQNALILYAHNGSTTGVEVLRVARDGVMTVSSPLNVTTGLTVGVGCVATGRFSVAIGVNSVAAGDSSFANGTNALALGPYSEAKGFGTRAYSWGSRADGVWSIASNNYAYAQGWSNMAWGTCGHAEGMGTVASGGYSHAEGLYTMAAGLYGAHAEGRNTRAIGTAAPHAEGYDTTASGFIAAHAEGRATVAAASYSHAEGYSTCASGAYSHTEGYMTLAAGVASHAAGAMAKATNSITWVWSDGTDFSSTSTNQFSVYASGGIRLLGGPVTIAKAGDLSMGTFTNMP